MSEYFGAGNYEKLKQEVATTLLFGCYFSLGIVILGLLFSGGIIRLLRVPEEIAGDAAVYLRIILFFLLTSGLYQWNSGRPWE